MLSFDSSLLAESGAPGDTRERHVLYAKELDRSSPGSNLVIIAYSQGDKDLTQRWISPHCLVVLTASRSRLFFMKDALRIIKDLRRRFVFSVVTTQSPFDDGIVGLLVRRRLGVIFIPQIRGDIFSSFWLRERFPLNFMKSILGHFILRRGDKIQVVSRWIKSELLQLGIDQEKIFVVPSAITFRPYRFSSPMAQDDFRGQMQIPSSVKLCLFVGRLTYQKNIPMLLDIIRSVLSKRKDVVFIIIGDGAERKKIIEFRVKNKEIAAAVRFMGQVSYEQIGKMYAIADLLLVTSRYEGLPRVVREAAASGLPVVTTNMSGVNEVVRDNQTGFVLECDDVAGFAERVNYLLDDDRLRSDFGCEARLFERESFDIELIVRKRVREWITHGPVSHSTQTSVH